MAKKYSVKINRTEDYIDIFNGIFKLSKTEKEILAEFIDVYLSLRTSSLNINPFSTDMKKRVAKRLDRDNFNTLNNYIKKLCEKKAISPTTDGYEINAMLIPQNEDRIEFHLDYEQD